MEIVSFIFLGFFVISSLINYILPKNAKKIWLLIVSILFYLSWDIRFVLVLSIMILINYWFFKKVQANNERRIFWLGSLLLNIGSFFLIKLLNSQYVSLLNSGDNSIWGSVILPVGFSYYALQLITFTIEVNNNRLKVPSLLDFFLFFFYFPKLLSGPIEKPKSFLIKLDQIQKIDKKLIFCGINLIFSGLIRKLFIANVLSIFLPNWVNDVSSIGWAHVLGFVVYVYNDFAGYTLIVRGVSCFFGIELSSNFLQPLLSKNFGEFWNRWHITLSTWLRENIYFPLSRKLNRMQNISFGREISYVIPPMITMIASGFWHGASFALFLWGCIFGLFMILERVLFEKWPAIRRFSSVGYGAWFSRIVVFVLFSFGMVPLATNWTKGSFKVWGNLFSEAGFQMNDAVIPVLLLGLFSFILDYASEKSGKEIWWEDLHVIPRSAIVAFGILLIIISIILIYFYPSTVFIYQGF